jgi:O-antigen/teichoic acid export membrane protein
MIGQLRASASRLLPSGAPGSVRTRLLRGAFWSALNTILTRLLNLGGAVVVGRTLGPDGYGHLGAVQSTIGLFGLLAAMGTSVTATKYVAQYRDTDPARTGRLIALAQLIATGSALLFALLVFGFAPLLARHTLADPAITPLLRIGTLLLLANAINGAKTGALAGFEAFRSIALVDVVGNSLGVGCSLVGVHLAGVEGALTGLVVGLFAQSVGYSLALRRTTRQAGIEVRLGEALTEWRVLVGFSAPALLSAAIAAGANWGTNAILVHQAGGYTQLGIYNAANQWRTAIMFLPSTLSAALLPVLSNLVGTKDRRHGKVLGISVAVNALIAFGAAGVVILLGDWIMRAYGRGFAGHSDVLTPLVLAAAVIATTTVVGQAIISVGKMWWAFGLNGIWAVVLLSAAWGWRTDGALGLARAQLVAYGLHLLTSGYLAHRVSRLTEAPSS